MRQSNVIFSGLRNFILMTLLALTGLQAGARQGEEIFLWGERPAPGSADVRLTEDVVDPEAPNRRVFGIGRPSVSVFLPAVPNGAAVLIVPGGGYERLSIDTEGADVARWLNTFGVAAFVLKHRLPDEGHAQGRHVVLQDGQRAMRLIRFRAAEWGIDPQRVGVMGFSAGGHLAAMLATTGDRELLPPLDAVDRQRARPDFAAYLYAVLAKPDMPPPGSTIAERTWTLIEYPVEELVRSDTSPAFFVTGADDLRVDPLENSLRFFLKLRKADVPAELHMYRHADHGFATRPTAGPVAQWTTLFEAWMKAAGYLRMRAAQSR